MQIQTGFTPISATGSSCRIEIDGNRVVVISAYGEIHEFVASAEMLAEYAEAVAAITGDLQDPGVADYYMLMLRQILGLDDIYAGDQVWPSAHLVEDYVLGLSSTVIDRFDGGDSMRDVAVCLAEEILPVGVTLTDEGLEDVTAVLTAQVQRYLRGSSMEREAAAARTALQAVA